MWQAVVRKLPGRSGEIVTVCGHHHQSVLVAASCWENLNRSVEFEECIVIFEEVMGPPQAAPPRSDTGPRILDSGVSAYLRHSSAAGVSAGRGGPERYEDFDSGPPITF
jgi:hypothetical protein